MSRRKATAGKMRGSRRESPGDECWAALVSDGREMLWCVTIFFFQAEDGIRDYKVTGVQTCALPIFSSSVASSAGTGAWQEAWRQVAAGAPEANALADKMMEDLQQHPWLAAPMKEGAQIGRAACRGRGEISVVAVSLKKKKRKRTKVV